MKQRATVAIVLGLAAALVASPAAARRWKGWMHVDGFSPRSGPPGTLVTITGRGFIGQTTVVFDGRPVRSESRDRHTIRFRVPEGRTGGVIELRQPGLRHDVMVGTFLVTGPAATITGFAPRSGPPGTRVELYGRFAPGDEIRFDGHALELLDRSATRAVVAIPPGARDAVFELLRRATGERTASREPFHVLPGAPYVTDLRPAGVPPGTLVRVTGGNFTSGDAVSYGAHMPAQVERRGRDWFEARVPPDAARSAPFVVRGPGGEARSPAPFALMPGAAITEIRPPSGPPGARVMLRGRGFLPGDTVFIGPLPAATQRLDEHRIVARLPRGARTNLLTLWRDGHSIAASAAPFVVVEPVGPPVIRTFAPAGGPPGTQVTLEGEGFTPDARVSYGGAALPILGRHGDDGVTVVVPREATRSAPFVVATRSGETRSGAWFDLQLAPTVDSVTPTSGPVGAEVMIRGRRFRGDEVFYLNTQPMPMVERRGDRATVRVPPGASSGPIAFTAAGRRYRTPFRFDVLVLPLVSSFAPIAGPPGTRVVVRGENLAATGAASYGRLPCAILRRSAHEVVIEIPPGAGGADFLWLDVAGQRVRGDARFHVTRPTPEVAGFQPTAGPPGSQVVIKGAHLRRVTGVWLGSVPCPVVSQAPRELVVTIPAGVGGRVPFTLADDAGGRFTTPLAFAVLPPPPPPDTGLGHHAHAHMHPHPDGGHHHHPHVHPHRPGVNHHHPY